MICGVTCYFCPSIRDKLIELLQNSDYILTISESKAVKISNHEPTFPKISTMTKPKRSSAGPSEFKKAKAEERKSEQTELLEQKRVWELRCIATQLTWPER